MISVLPETMTRCYAWAFLTNHAHLLVRTGKSPLSGVMARLLTGYAVSFNKRHHRHGPLFQNRYKSILCQEDAYLTELVRYIHLNPLRARIIPDLNGLLRYPWCGHGVLMGKRVRPFQDSAYVLSYFGSTKRAAREAYLTFMEAGLTHGRRPELTGGGLIRSNGGWKEVKHFREHRLKGDERILGDTSFVLRMLSEMEEKLDPRTALRRTGLDLGTIERRVTALYRITHDDLCSHGRRAYLVAARSLFCFWAVAKLGLSATTIARYLDMSQPGVGYAVDRGRRIASHEGYTLTEG